MDFYTDCRVHRGQILYRGWRNGKRVMEKVRYEPYLFLPTNNETGYKNLDGQNVTKRHFNSISEARNFTREHSDLPGFNYYGIENYQYLYIYDNYPGTIEYDRKQLSIVTLDIEIYADDGFPSIRDALKPVTTISITKNSKTYAFGYKYYEAKSDKVEYILCKDEEDLLRRFLQYWKHLDPDIVTGWNVEGFDIPYLVNRIYNVLGEVSAQKLSPWGIIEHRDINTSWGDVKQVWTLYGLTVLDYMDLYKNFSYKNQESHKLDHIAYVELGEKKTDYSGYNGLCDLYDRNFELYVDYNINDTILIDKLEAKLGFISIALSLAYLFKCNYSDTLATVTPWDACIHHILMDKGIVVPQYKKPYVPRSLVGGYNVEPTPGKYNWVMSTDIKSSYPHQIIQYNISPETYVKKLGTTIVDNIMDGDIEKYFPEVKKNNWSLAANLTCYSKDKKGFMPEIMELFFGRRAETQKLLKAAKKEYELTKDEKLLNVISQYDALQLALKIAINSFYGMLSNEYCRWYSLDLAEAITMSGQLSIRWSSRAVNNYFNKLLNTNKDYILAGDTDSNYISLEGIVNKLPKMDRYKTVEALERFYEERLKGVITQGFTDLSVYMNAYKDAIYMEKENIADVAIWRAKKNYVMNVISAGGTICNPPKIKMVGIEAVKASIPQVCRDKIKESLKIMLEGTNSELINFIDNFRKEFYNLDFISVACPSGINNIPKYGNSLSIYSKGTPIHVRGALLYNHLIKEKKLNKKYERIKDGDKIKYCYLKLPNPIREDVIASLDDLPPEFELNQYINYERQFHKGFLGPVESLCNAIKWRAEDICSLEVFFGE